MDKKEISKEQAITLCTELQAANRGRWFTYQAWWCWGCTTFTKGDPLQRCWANAPGNRGCEQVNRKYEGGSG